MAESVIRARLQTKGFEEGTAAVNRFSRAQQNVGKASAASGRQFSAQASGLGGFVAAYAGAAANIFAVQQAFSALSRAAQVETTIRGTRTLASEIGQSGDAIIAKLQEVTQSQLTAAEAAQNANIALSAGFDIGQIEDLTEVATKASKALGRNLTESIQRVYRGAIKLEPELLDEIGIFTRIEPAVEAYAASLNRSVSSLTNFERRQAFATAVIEEGQKKFNEIDITSKSAQKSLEQLSTQFIDLATKIGIVLANTLTPFVDFLSADLGNTLLVVGGIFALVFKNAGSQVAAFTESMVGQLTRGLGKLEEFGRKAQGTGEAFRGALSAAQGADYAGAGAFRGDRATASAATKAKQQIAAGEIRTQAQAAAARKALLAQIKAEEAYIRAIETGTKKVKDRDAAIGRSRIAIAAATVQTNALASAERAAGAASTVLAGTTRLLTTAVQGLGMAVSFLLSKLNLFLFVLTSIQSVGQLFGVDIIGSIVGWFQKLGEQSRKTTEGIQSFAAALTSVSKTELKLAGFEDQEEFLDQVSDKLNDLRTEYRQVGDVGYMTYQTLEKVTLSVAEATEKANLRIAEINDQMKGLEKRGRDNTSQYAKLNKELLVLKTVIETIPMRDFALLTAELANATGRNGKEVAESVKSLLDQGTIVNKNNKTLEAGSAVIARYVGEQFKLTKAGEAIAPTLIQADRLVDNFNKKFEEGSLDVEKASRAIVGLNAQIKANDKALKDGIITQEEFNAAEKVLKGILTEVKKDFDQLQTASKQLELFRKSFSSEIKLVDEAYQKGLIGIDGTIAKDSTQAFENRLKLIKRAKAFEAELVVEGKKFKDINEAIANGNAVQVEQARQVLASRKAEAGLIIQLRQDIEKMAVEEGKLLLKLQGQSKELQLQANVLKEQIKLNQIKNKSLALDVLQAETNVLKQQVALEKIRFENIMKSSKAERDLLSARQEGASMQRDIDTTNFKIGIDAMALRDQERLIRAQKKVFDSRNRSERDILVAQRELLAIEYRNKRNELDRRRAIAEFEYKNAMAEITEKLKIIEFERTDLVKRIAFEKDQQQKAFDILKTEQKIANDRLQIKIDELRGQKDYINAQRELEILKVRNQEAAFLNGLKEIQERYRLLDAQKRLLKEDLDIRNKILVKSGSEEVNVDTSFLASDTSAMAELDKRINQTTANYADKISMIGIKYDDQISTINQQIQNQERLLQIQKEAQRIAREIQIEQDAGRITDLEAQRKLLDQKIINTNQEFTGLEAKHLRVLAQLDAEGQKEYLNYQSRLYQLDEENNKITQFTEKLNAAFSGTLNESIDSLFTSLENGTLTASNFKDGVGDLFLNLLKDVRQSFVDEFVKEPLTDLIKDFVGGIMDAFKEGMDGGKGGSSGLIGQIGGFIGSFLVPNSPTATPGVSAIGGPVQKMAAGGNVTSGRSVSLRDRVPTLLEPGEFVIRKPAAKAIGGSALRELNATGKVNQNPNISVNVSNQGTPQEVVKTEARPDMGQLVIDLVVKDIENNGRTRKALRGA